MNVRVWLGGVWFGLHISGLVACGSTLPGEWVTTQSAGFGASVAGHTAAGSGAFPTAGTLAQAGVGGRAGSGARGGNGSIAGSGVAGTTARRQDIDVDGYDFAIDCNDFDPDVYPGAPETCCDGIDSNCDGQDNTPQCDCDDRDHDGYSIQTPGQYRDCDDSNAAIHPFAAEQCSDGRDNNCDGLTDAADKACAALVDHDADGFAYDIDCNDFDANIHPKARELCDRIDNDCDGIVDPAPCPASVDADGDGFVQSDDCNDWDAKIFPGAPDACCDAVDSNCDGNDDPLGVMCSCADGDGDGYLVGPVEGKLADCNDQDRFIHPGAPEICTDNIDNDCDRHVDADDSECRIYVAF